MAGDPARSRAGQHRLHAVGRAYPALREAAAARFMGDMTRGIDGRSRGRGRRAAGAKPFIGYAVLAGHGVRGRRRGRSSRNPGLPIYRVAGGGARRGRRSRLRAARGPRIRPRRGGARAAWLNDATRLLILDSPQNPTGGSALPAEALAEVARDRGAGSPRSGSTPTRSTRGWLYDGGVLLSIASLPGMYERTIIWPTARRRPGR